MQKLYSARLFLASGIRAREPKHGDSQRWGLSEKLHWSDDVIPYLDAVKIPNDLRCQRAPLGMMSGMVGHAPVTNFVIQTHASKSHFYAGSFEMLSLIDGMSAGR
jgi:hypothetical protein